jgi:hypothetical protein
MLDGLILLLLDVYLLRYYCNAVPIMQQSLTTNNIVFVSTKSSWCVVIIRARTGLVGKKGSSQVSASLSCLCLIINDSTCLPDCWPSILVDPSQGYIAYVS